LQWIQSGHLKAIKGTGGECHGEKEGGGGRHCQV
jgi:hypothetical protein